MLDLRTRWKILISVVVAAVIIMGVFGAFVTGLLVLPSSTELTIVPSDIAVGSGGSVVLSAQLRSNGFLLSGKSINWSTSAGSFDESTGYAVVFTAPVVAENTSVTVTASFAGDGKYLKSSSTATGLVTPPIAASTALSITPSAFEVTSGGTVTLTATLIPSSAPSETITWSVVGPGKVSPGTGTSVTYQAPVVQENATVEITATLPGTAAYVGSNATCTGAVSPPGVVVKKTTTLGISPTSFTLEANKTLDLTATLKDNDGNILTGKDVVWSLVGPGSLSTTTGMQVTYTAPQAVAENATARISATFAGDANYTGASAISTGMITPAPALAAGDAYVMAFNEGLFGNIAISGPLTMNGTSVVRIVANTAEIEAFNLSHIGLSALNVTMGGLEIYATNITAYSPELAKTLTISGRDQVSLGPYATLTFENATILFVQMSAQTAELRTAKVLGETVGGAEPYVPTIISAPKVALSNNYALTGPVTYGLLTSATHSFTMGMAVISELSLVHPSSYSLDRGQNTFTDVDKWVARASVANITNVASNCIFVHFVAYGVFQATLSGEDNPNLMEHANVGLQGTVNDASIHLVFATMDRMICQDLVIEIV